jgi:hypothetical protein
MISPLRRLLPALAAHATLVVHLTFEVKFPALGARATFDQLTIP